ncbi:MAG: HlyD family efflux transporter periplasmic adaptor subunit [Candidatus Aminicenantes bacterium]|nr:HlyD family efflux transporter periplasmic adaptor subunit [Candidatus Aminicenantes bacterium]
MKNNVFALFLAVILVLGGSLAAVAADAQGTEQEKVKCPGRVPVEVETVQPAPFSEYARLKGAARPEVVPILSPVAGVVSQVQVAEGSLVDSGQELAVLNAGQDEKVQALEQEVARRKKILTARQNWKEKSERAIQVAEKDYQAALASLEQARSLAGHVVAAPLAGIVRVKTAPGTEIGSGELLFEIVDPLNLRVESKTGNASLFTVGETLPAAVEDQEGELQAEVVSAGDGGVRLRVANPQGQLREGVIVHSRKRIVEHAEAIAIPDGAVEQDSLGDFVYVAEKKRAKKIYVTLGASEAGRTRIEKGLSPGSQIIVSGFECLSDNKKIKVAVTPAPAAESAIAADLGDKKAEAAARADEAKARKEKERLEKEEARKAAAEAELRKKQEDEAARKEAKAQREKEKQEKLAAKKAEAEAAKAARAEKKKAAAEAKKSACPRKVPVLVELTRAETFREYGYYTAPALAETVVVAAPAPGVLHALKVEEGAQVQRDQELFVLTVGESDEVAGLRREAERRHQALVARQNAKVRNERAIQAAEREYQKALALLEEKAAPFVQAFSAPVAGVVRSLQAAPGAEIAAGVPLLEIVTEQQLLVTIALDADSARFLEGEQAGGTFAGQEAETSAEIVEAGHDRAVLRLDNAAGQIQVGSPFTVRKLKREHAEAVTVPVAALQQDSLGDFVFVVEKKKARKTYVTTGATEAGRTLVPKGLGVGLPLVVSGFECLAEGKKVRVVDEEQLAREKEALQAEKPAPKPEEPAQPQLPGIDAFIAYLEANREALGYDRYERTEIDGRPAVRIVSGLETQKQLLDLVNEYAVAEMGLELKDERVISIVIFKVPERIRKEKPARVERAGLFGGRLSLAAHGTYYLMLDKNFKEAYVSLAGFGGSLAFRFASKLDFWASGGMAAKNNQPEWSPEELKFRMIPLSAAVRYFLVKQDKLSVFAGAGPSVFLVKDINPAGDIKTTIIGANALAGGHYWLSKKVFAQMFVKFNLASKDIYPDSDLDDPLNLTGLELNLGVGIVL